MLLKTWESTRYALEALATNEIDDAARHVGALRMVVGEEPVSFDHVMSEDDLRWLRETFARPVLPEHVNEHRSELAALLCRLLYALGEYAGRKSR